eukprot:TRINITY_DN6144_c0_g2_i2.p1 TRINITY_DN6144_c0_g2~~TRINITY_DN6144_c0_g2_i2.p1  ORF type:complete len:162 (+),score=47.19 TRINITY_DN6144_c0_g2_i2:268-753(+)
MASASAPKALVAIADGSEEMEAVILIDVLRRGKVNVTVASVSEALTVTASRMTKITADIMIDEVKNETYDLIVLPGGKDGAENLGKCDILISLLKAQRDAGKWYAAVCAAPALALQPHGLLGGRKATCYPSFANKLDDHSTDKVVISGNCSKTLVIYVGVL